MKTRAARILVVDDETDMLNGCSKIIQALGYIPATAASGALAIDLLQQDEFDLILCDLFMPDVDGKEVLKQAKQLAPFTPVVIFTAYGTIGRAVDAMKYGAFDFIEKPFDIEYLKVLIKKGLKQRRLYQERTNLINQLEEKYSFENIIGKSMAMRRIFDTIESIAKTDASVLITGESGTGKELIARSLHARSNRKKNPFVPVNCSAFPESLFEAELFGYERGAFTGANKRKMGLLEFADGGTFFLDEVCELPNSLQAKLLRVLQDQRLRHIGGTGLIQVDVRVISATNWDLQQAREKGVLRDDFYYRLNVVNIHLPPLRERPEDIPLLMEHFLREQLKSSPKSIQGFHPQVMDLFQVYPWPGNVRELENVVEHAISLARGDEILLNDLPESILQFVQNHHEIQPLTSLPLAEAKRRAIEKTEKTYLLALLKEYHGNITKIAEKSKMTRRNLHRILNRHGLNPAAWRNQK
ncbi:MAG: sigma-54-dependent Fis family transcriptional regulator [Calditrichaeota bacterium]|nr:sigma-54-dependent Fis family transcriptional regulator [Calditrichota bacterium]